MKDPLAIFTIVQNEPVWLPVWMKHYRSQLDAAHLYILDHDSDGEGAALLDELKRAGANVVPVHRRVSFDHSWLAETVERFQRFLLSSYEAVLFVEIDEIVATAPGSQYAGLGDYAEVVLDRRHKFVRCAGFEVVHKPEEEPPLDWTQPLLKQRKWWYASEKYSKPLLSRMPLSWRKGFHRTSNVRVRSRQIDQDLLLIHLHKLDFDYCVRRHEETASRDWMRPDGKTGSQNRMVGSDDVRAWFRRSIDDDKKEAELVAIPAEIQTII
ncbi:MAG: glycosyltransferase family 2 protein [Deltaproteobacteria bacterium]